MGWWARICQELLISTCFGCRCTGVDLCQYGYSKIVRRMERFRYYIGWQIEQSVEAVFFPEWKQGESRLPFSELTEKRIVRRLRPSYFDRSALWVLADVHVTINYNSTYYTCLMRLIQKIKQSIVIRICLRITSKVKIGYPYPHVYILLKLSRMQSACN